MICRIWSLVTFSPSVNIPLELVYGYTTGSAVRIFFQLVIRSALSTAKWGPTILLPYKTSYGKAHDTLPYNFAGI